VEGFLHWVKEEGERFISVERVLHFISDLLAVLDNKFTVQNSG
jgi:hypothetical protein